MQKTIAIAGGFGFVGKRLVQSLHQLSGYKIIGLSSRQNISPIKGMDKAISANLFSLKEATQALQGVDYAFYLVHSMLPQNHLTQGNFRDLDLIAADNFAKACKICGVKKIIYLGGIIPQNKELSTHLQSRLEVENTLASSGLPVVTLRAGLIIGYGGSSYEMMKRLVFRLPVMICPKWTFNLTQPIDLDDVVECLIFALEKSDSKTCAYDIGGRDALSYQQMMQRLAHDYGRKIKMLRFGFFSAKLSTLWVRLVTGAPKNLVKPLILSLKHSMLPRDFCFQNQMGQKPLGFLEAIKKAKKEAQTQEQMAVHAYQKRKTVRKKQTVQSVQRLILPKTKNAYWVSLEYARWLESFLAFMIKVKWKPQKRLLFYLVPFRIKLLELSFAPDRSPADRPLFYITGGILNRPNPKARLEFREVLDGQYLLAAIHDFKPKLPWFIYKFSQAPFHLWIMRRFGQHLKNKNLL